MDDGKVLTPQEIWQMQLEHQRKIQKELDKLKASQDTQQEIVPVQELFNSLKHKPKHGQLIFSPVFNPLICQFVVFKHRWGDSEFENLNLSMGMFLLIQTSVGITAITLTN